MEYSPATTNSIAQKNKVKQGLGDYQVAGRPLFHTLDKLSGQYLGALTGQSIVGYLLPWFYLVSQGFFLQFNRHRLSAPGGFNWAYVASGAGVA